MKHPSPPSLLNQMIQKERTLLQHECTACVPLCLWGMRMGHSHLRRQNVCRRGGHTSLGDRFLRRWVAAQNFAESFLVIQTIPLKPKGCSNSYRLAMSILFGHKKQTLWLRECHVSFVKYDNTYILNAIPAFYVIQCAYIATVSHNCCVKEMEKYGFSSIRRTRWLKTHKGIQ